MELNLKRPTLQFKLGLRCYRFALESKLPPVARGHSLDPLSRRLMNHFDVATATCFSQTYAEAPFYAFALLSQIWHYLGFVANGQISPRVSARLFRLFITENHYLSFANRWVLCPRHNTCQNLFPYPFIFLFHSRGVKYLRNLSSLETFDIHPVLSICLVTTTMVNIDRTANAAQYRDFPPKSNRSGFSFR